MNRRRPFDSAAVLAVILAGLVFSTGALRAQVVINEVLASNLNTNTDDDGDTSDWVELFNAGAAAVDLDGYGLSDDRARPRRWVFPPVNIDPGSFLLVWCSGKDRTSAAPELIAARNSPLELVPDLVSLDDEWRYLGGAPEDAGPPSDWASPEFDDSAWERGRPGFGFGRADDIMTPLPEGTSAAFLRTAFDFTPGRRNLVLQLRYDDGFVAFLNGVRVAADNFPDDGELTFASQASSSHSSRTRERVDLSDRLDLLRPGRNVLAIALLNLRPTSNDMVLFAELGSVPPVFHTDFRLAREGEPLLLADPQGTIVDSVDLSPQMPDQSYGRSPNGSGPFLYHLTPTPLAANEGPASQQPLLVADTRFSHDRGFYDEPFEVEITTATEGAEIRYTLDGTTPTGENGMLYEGPIPIDGTTTLRARAFLPGREPTNVDTQTYIFVDDIVAQDVRATIARGFPSSWVSTSPDYGMDPEVIGPNDRFGGVYAETVRDDLKSLPSLSIVMLAEDLFGSRGIYSNSQQGGVAWERPGSVELISADDGPEFQIDCGVRIQGGAFRSHGLTKKHSFRLLFKREYGATKLEFPLFGDTAVDRFDTLTLRAGANDGYAWAAARNTEQYTRDEFGRSLQRATGNAGSHGIFVHLYLNGVYWGLYNIAERPDHAFSASYHGGDKEDWDAIHDLEATNGTNAAWNEMVRGAASARTSIDAYLALQGMNPQGERDPELPHLLDVPNYVDYLIVNLWGGNWDWPWKNWWAGRDRTEASTGFKFYCWDFENTMGNNRNRSPLAMNALQNNFSSAGVPHQSLRVNPEYRLLFGDRVHRFFFNGGVLTPESLASRYEEIAEWIRRAMVPESARWGDQHHHPPLTLREWERELNWILGTYIPQRSGIVLDQFRAAGLYPRVAAPTYNVHGGIVEAGFVLLPRAPAGTVYYTVDGTDPRRMGSDVSASAQVANTGEEVVLLPQETDARIHVPTGGTLGFDWTALDFDDSGWQPARTAIGYERSSGYEEIIATDVGDLMHEINASIYIRIPFEVGDPSPFAFMALRMRYDDGFVAWLNGERIADRRARDLIEWDSRAAGTNPDSAAVRFETIEVDDAIDLLRSGINVLAIQGFNSRSSDSDFLIQPELVATDPTGAGIVIESSVSVRSRALVDDQWSALNEADFIVDTDIPLRITEVMFNPPAPPAGSRYTSDEFEFIELLNVGAEALDLSEIRLGGGVQFDFSESTVEILGPGEYLLLVENLDAFGTVHDVTDLLIAGEYSGRLANGGETLILEGFLGEPILSFTFDDEWHPLADGGGSSLEIIDPFGARESWNDRDSWRPSERRNGSPGGAGSDQPPAGRQRPGDTDQDGRLTIGDPVRILRLLFIEENPTLPCEGTLDSRGNRMVHDADGSGEVTIGDAIALLDTIFRRGAPPALGTECLPIAGCPTACR